MRLLFHMTLSFLWSASRFYFAGLSCAIINFNKLSILISKVLRQPIYGVVGIIAWLTVYNAATASVWKHSLDSIFNLLFTNKVA